MENQKIRIVKMVLRNKNKIGRFTLPDFQTKAIKLHCRINVVLLSKKTQNNRIKNLEIAPTAK